MGRFTEGRKDLYPGGREACAGQAGGGVQLPGKEPVAWIQVV